MHAIFSSVFGAFVRILDWTSQLARLMGGMFHDASGTSTLALASIVVASLLLCVLACVWALAERMRAAARQFTANAALAHAQSETRFREAMLQAVPEAMVILDADLGSPVSYRGGSALLRACLSGPDSQSLAPLIDDLLEGGTPFATSVRAGGSGTVVIQGGVVGSRAALFLRADEGEGTLERAALSILQTLPVPIWIRDSDMSLRWANCAFLAATGTASLDNARRTDPRLVRAEQDLATAALEGRDVAGERRYTVIGGRRRALSVDMLRLPQSRVAGIAMDVTDTAQAESQLKLANDAQADMLDHLGDALAVFGADRKLAFANAALARLWDLPEEWLRAGPTLDDIFDRLRESRRLPEQRDFHAWKRGHLRLFESDSGELDETWHLSGGPSIRVRAFPYLLGGVFYLFEDITESLRLHASLRVLKGTQHAMLDAIEDGMAMFGSDGKLKMYNSAFTELWGLSDMELESEPHLAVIEAKCTAHFGRDGIWSLVASGTTSVEPSRYGEWGRMVRADGRALSVSLTRLPLGATLVQFEDLTDLERFGSVLASDVAA